MILRKKTSSCTNFTFQTGKRYCQATRWTPEEGRGKKLEDPLGHSPDLSSAQASDPHSGPFSCLAAKLGNSNLVFDRAFSSFGGGLGTPEQW